MPKNRTNKSKWQEASNLVNKYRTDIANMLRLFTVEERQNIRFDELLDDIKSNACRSIRDVVPEKAGDCAELEGSESETINWKSKKLWIILCGSPVLVEAMKYLPDLFKYLAS